MKTNKHKTLLLARKTQPLHARHLVLHFDYAPGTVRSYLSHLGRQGLLEQMPEGYRLTKKGHDRIRYFDIFGCGRPGCPWCKGKSGYLSCPECGNRISKQKARISKERDYFLVRRHAGVYCDRCSALILDDAQARQLGIAKEE
jgi:predicted methyltransferase